MTFKRVKKIAVIMLIIGTLLLIPTILLAIYVDSAISTVLLVLSLIINIAAVNTLVVGSQLKHRKRALEGGDRIGRESDKN
ncbi:MAG: hypothetical protein IJF27_00050 [Oscillospiraceae bacterium]|nr:hypothetical protein [Oscillospiraceae bacterium]MBQ3050081.1 hypothetical protein [Oscillospiraceae bacterium]MBQ9938198.1 hypothetical protein [Oscillospiraceae bacterium]